MRDELRDGYPAFGGPASSRSRARFLLDRALRSQVLDDSAATPDEALTRRE
jgi:hypothetical protein